MDNEHSPLLHNQYNEQFFVPNEGLFVMKNGCLSGGEDISPTCEKFIDSFVSAYSAESAISASEFCNYQYEFSILYVDFPQVFYKKQVRSNKQSMQRIDNGNVTFLLEFGSAVARNSAKHITIKVKRLTNKQHKDVFIKSQLSLVQKTKVLVKLNLDSVYEVDNFKVYELDKSVRDDRKRFNLEIEVYFCNNKTFKQNTHSFVLIGRKRSQNTMKFDQKRPRLNTTDLCSSDCSTLSESPTSTTSSIKALLSPFISPNYSPSFEQTDESTNNFYTYSENDKVLKCSKLVADHVQTKALQLGNLFLDQTIQTTNGDIAYHWPLENEDEQFEEGEIVGFIADKSGKYYLRKLTLKNCSEALLKGVISRSYYLQAQVPTDGRRSETICMMGIVPVQVKGSVCINDALYASPDFPGFAVSSYHLNTSLLQSCAHIGYAFSSQNVADEKVEGMVKAGVSVLESASRCLQDVRLRTLEERLESKFNDICIKQKRSKKYTRICFFAWIALAILSGVFLYQIFVPGTSFRYFLCKQGRMSGSAFFQFIPTRDITVYPNVRGIQFEFSVLMQKTAHTGYKRLNMTGVRYFMNLDRCAYKSLTQSSSIILQSNIAYGPDLFAVDKECYHAFYYDEPNDRWKRYISVSWETKQNIFCQPPPISKNITFSET
ncbi:uncharacterized protein LOC101240970 isoform X1 [Hydra vulgaris]|uniref:uncharacterized protein LOC101240970 isoform X1 n=1 Tax=Hydra vulgaris TaxID=6087 RepID=UPI001F5F51E0|nr:uncharacterized protein LOC101240970 isoform X1 [Hydra vulgaris]XP_047139408.1 uncharacterized protein LOC101240970 isoform X1 [Hydra vulgaris]XP_047139409.1 uncharacterized protein LOC101240970 isoform X1 [Hydra vulgaris]